MRAVTMLLAISLMAVASPRASAAVVHHASSSAAQPPRFGIVDRVEVNYGGTWYPGVITGVDGNRYQVKRDDYTQDFKWLDASLIRPLGYAKPAPSRPRTALPPRIPTGVYSCWTITSGFGSSNSTGSAMGDIRITGAGTYTGLSRNGAGPSGRYSYDASTGIVSWEGGKVAGFFGTPTETTFAIDTKGSPYLDIVYRVRAGGNLFNLSCRKT